MAMNDQLGHEIPTGGFVSQPAMETPPQYYQPYIPSEDANNPGQAEPGEMTSYPSYDPANVDGPSRSSTTVRYHTSSPMGISAGIHISKHYSAGWSKRTQKILSVVSKILYAIVLCSCFTLSVRIFLITFGAVVLYYIVLGIITIRRSKKTR